MRPLLLTILLATSSVLAAESPPRRIAYLTSDTPCASNVGLRALKDGLRSLGYRDGENVHIECRSADGKYERLDALAAELVRQQPAVFVAAAAPASLAAKRATSTLPIVSLYTADPVGLGLVASLARPDTNVTGISALASDYAAKSLQLLREVAPRVSRVGILGHRANPTYAIYRSHIDPAARSLGLTLDFAGAETPDEIGAALVSLQQRGAQALVVMHQPFTFDNQEQIVERVNRLGLPAVYGSREAVEAGGLMSYAVNVSDTYRRGAHFVDKVLRGTKPAEIPVEQPTKFELVVNLKTARALGLTVPKTVLLRADQRIE